MYLSFMPSGARWRIDDYLSSGKMKCSV
jgi:hypothetical protein